MEGEQGWRRHGGAWVEGHRVEEAWPTFSNLTSPSRESVPLPLSQTDFFFSTQALFFPLNHLRGPRSVAQALSKPFALSTIR